MKRFDIRLAQEGWSATHIIGGAAPLLSAPTNKNNDGFRLLERAHGTQDPPHFLTQQRR